MKKTVLVAVLAAAVPAALPAQPDCPAERCQIAPYFAGEGGFVGTSAGLEGESEVQFWVVCGNVTVSAAATPDADGIVRQALNAGNGFGCRAGAQGRVEVDNLRPGGWYWINDDRNSAVSAFIPKDAAGNEKIEVTDPGGVVLSREADGAATYVKHPGSGRVGIVPNVVPARPIKDCSGALGSAAAGDCHLGLPTDWRLVPSPAAVTRPTGNSPNKEVVVTLHGERFITTDTIAASTEVQHHSDVQSITSSDTARPTIGSEPGVLVWTVSVGADDNRCLPANNHPDRLNPQTITFLLDVLDGVIPDIPSDGVQTTFTVNCPAEASASRGVELAPGNPFPVD